MNNIFEQIFYSLYYQAFMPAFLVIAIIFAILILILGKYFSKKYSKRIVTVICTVAMIPLIFIIYEAIPYYFKIHATLTCNTQEAIANYNNAIKFAIIPAEKGFLYADLGTYYGGVMHNGVMAIENYENAYKYLKTYKSKKSLWGVIAALNYKARGDFDKAIEIFEEIEAYGGIATVYILKNDYKNALIYSTKFVLKSPNSHNYVQRATIYKNLGNNDLAQKDYDKALKLCRNQTQKDQIQNIFKNYKTYEHDRNNIARKNLNL